MTAADMLARQALADATTAPPAPRRRPRPVGHLGAAIGVVVLSAAAIVGQAAAAADAIVVGAPDPAAGILSLLTQMGPAGALIGGLAWALSSMRGWTPAGTITVQLDAETLGELKRLRRIAAKAAGDEATTDQPRE